MPEGGAESAAPLARQHIYPNVINQIDIRGKSQQAHALWLMSQAADSISDSDLVQQQIRGAQNWGLLPLYGLTATAKVGLLAGEHNARPVQPQFPTMLGQISKGNKRARILRELAMHTSAKFSGGANGLRMDYFSLLRQRLTQPLVQRQAAGVEEVRLKIPRPLEIPKPRPNGARPVFGSGDWAAG